MVTRWAEACGGDLLSLQAADEVVVSVHGAPGRHSATADRTQRLAAGVVAYGRKIVFVRIVGRANRELFVMNADGTHQRRLTFNPGPDVASDWQPLPR